MYDYRRGFGLDIGSIDHFITQFVITLNYSASANFHTLKITTAPAKPSAASCIFTSRSLVYGY
jgi:hypothetical protein